MTIATRPNRGNAVLSNRKAGRPKGDRDDVPVKLDRALVEKARVVAAHRQTTLAELLSTLLDEPLERAHSQMLASLANADPEISTIFNQIEQYFSALVQKPEVEAKAESISYNESMLASAMKLLHEKLRTSEDAGSASLKFMSEASKLISQDSAEDASQELRVASKAVFRELAESSDGRMDLKTAFRDLATPSDDKPASGTIIEKSLGDQGDQDASSGKKSDGRKRKRGKP